MSPLFRYITKECQAEDEKDRLLYICFTLLSIKVTKMSKTRETFLSIEYIESSVAEIRLHECFSCFFVGEFILTDSLRFSRSA